MVFAVLTVVICFLFIGSAASETFRLGLSKGQEELLSYEISVLRLALRHAPDRHELVLQPIPQMSQDRNIQLISENAGLVNLMLTANSPERSSKLMRVDIPLTRGLLGHRVLVINKSDLPLYNNLSSAEDIKKLSIGTGLNWPENKILNDAGYKTVQAGYDNLWHMLTRNRFNAFHRGIQEFSIELKQRKALDLTTVPGVILYCPIDYFFFVSKESLRLHSILLQGLQNAYKSGAFMKNFKTHPSIRRAFEQGKLRERRIIPVADHGQLENIKSIPAKYWHTPSLNTH